MIQKIKKLFSLLLLILLINIWTVPVFATNERDQNSESQATITFIESDKKETITPIKKSGISKGKPTGFLPQTGEHAVVLWLVGIVFIELWLLIYLKRNSKQQSASKKEAVIK